MTKAVARQAVGLASSTSSSHSSSTYNPAPAGHCLCLARHSCEQQPSNTSHTGLIVTGSLITCAVHWSTLLRRALLIQVHRCMPNSCGSKRGVCWHQHACCGCHRECPVDQILLEPCTCKCCDFVVLQRTHIYPGASYSSSGGGKSGVELGLRA